MASQRISARCVVLLDQRQLLIDGEPARIGSRAFDILAALLARRGELVSKTELMSSVWPGLVVDDNNLAVHVSALRRLLGSEVITTVPGRGYRLEGHSGERAEQAMRDHMVVGRELDLSSLTELLASHRLISLVGATGIGKTTLGRRVMQELGPQFANGASWCDLDTVADPAAVGSRLAQALGVEHGPGELTATLAHTLAGMHMLIVLDGVERVAEEVARLAHTLLDAAPGVHLLVTSQVPLRLEAEHVLRLQPLTIPASTASASQALAHGSVALFVARAGQGAHGFELTDANVADVITICRRLDGIPLAIELAAARATTLGTGALARMLDHRLRLLRSFNRAAPVRHATLRAALEWSHGLLTPTERIVFRRAGIFQRGFTARALVEVADDGSIGGPTVVVDALQSLVDKSLVHLDPGPPPRFRLLESTHSLALEYLQDAGELRDTAARHAQSMVKHFMQAYQDANEARRSADEVRASLLHELDNAQAVMAWALLNDPPAACALMPALSFACADLRFADVQALWEATRHHVSDALEPRVHAHWALGHAVFWSNRDVQAMDHWATIAARIFESLGDRDGQYWAQAALVVVAARRGEGVDEALATLDALEDESLSPTALRYGVTAAAIAASVRGDSPLAIKLLDRAVQLAQRIGDSHNLAAAQINLLDAALAQGRVDDAIAYGEAAVQQMLRKRRHSLMSMAQLNLGAAYAVKGLIGRTAELAREAWPMAVAEGLQPYWADYLALAAAQCNRLADAAQLLGYGDTGYRQYHTQRVANELAAAELARALVLQGMSPSELEQARAQGSRLGDGEVAMLIDSLVQAAPPTTR